MIDLLKQTGLSFSSGQKLTSDALNILNNRINDLVTAMNVILKDNLNVNTELEDKEYDLQDFLHLVPESRRNPGLKVRFLDKTGSWVECIFIGNDWFDEKNWLLSLDSGTINGGEW